MIKAWLLRGAKVGAKALGRAALQTGRHILSDIADNPEGYKDIISKHIRQTLPAKMAGGVVANANARHHAPDAPH